jgi:hypothetical protein
MTGADHPLPPEDVWSFDVSGFVHVQCGPPRAALELATAGRDWGAAAAAAELLAHPQLLASIAVGRGVETI